MNIPFLRPGAGPSAEEARVSAPAIPPASEPQRLDVLQSSGTITRDEAERLRAVREPPQTVRHIEVPESATSSLVTLSGPARTDGRGITVPVAPQRPGLAVSLDAYAARPLTTDVSKLRVAVAADHGAWQQAEDVAAYLRDLGVAEVRLFAPREGETLNYAVAGSAALGGLESGEVDRVVALCGNGLGVLDVANQFAEEAPGPKVTRPPVYADNFWKVVDSQRGDAPANVMCMGARLLAVDDNPARAFVKAFLEAPAVADALAKPGAMQEGVATALVDPKPGRVEKRRLPQGLDAALVLSTSDRAAIRAARPVVYYQEGNPTARYQARELEVYLRPMVTVKAWNGSGLPPTGASTRVIYLADGPVDGVPQRDRGFWRPAAEDGLAVYNADLQRGIAWFASEAPHDALTLNISSAALTNDATDGERGDVLRLFAKTFLLTPRATNPPVKALYGDAVRFVSGVLGVSAMPDDLAEWVPRLASLVPRQVALATRDEPPEGS